MKKTTRVKRKAMGRPPTGVTPLMGFRADPKIRAAIVRWAEKQSDMPTLSEAIRRLVELGLTVKTNARQPSAANAGRAKELARSTVEQMLDPAAPPEERAQRRRRLIKGPSEFREHRMDQAKGNHGRK
jgi:hypothetical protein